MAPFCTTSGTYTANRIILGFFGSPVESLCEISVVDVWFAHERPKYLAWYGWSLALTGKLAPMLAGFINYGMDWQWTLWWWAIFIGIAFVYCFFLMEETNYDRKYQGDGSHTPTSSSQVNSRSPAVASEIAVAHPQDADSKAPALVAPQEDRESGEIVWPQKSYWDKLGLKDKKRPNRLLNIAWAPIKGFTYPAVVYAG